MDLVTYQWRKQKHRRDVEKTHIYLDSFLLEISFFLPLRILQGWMELNERINGMDECERMVFLGLIPLYGSLPKIRHQFLYIILSKIGHLLPQTNQVCELPLPRQLPA